MENLNLLQKFIYLIKYANYMQICQGHQNLQNIKVLSVCTTTQIVLEISKFLYVILIVYGMQSNPMTPFA